MTQRATDPAIIKLPAVRLSFPHLFKARAFSDGDDPEYSADLILDNKQHTDLIKHINTVIERATLDKFHKKVHLKHCCLHDGNDKMDKEGYGDGTHYVVAKSDVRPAVIDRDLTPLTGDDKKIYGGCYVNALIRIYPWGGGKWGNGVSADLKAVQFLKDGDSFGAGWINVEDEFEVLPEDSGTGKTKAASQSDF